MILQHKCLSSNLKRTKRKTNSWTKSVHCGGGSPRGEVLLYSCHGQSAFSCNFCFYYRNDLIMTVSNATPNSVVFEIKLLEKTPSVDSGVEIHI